MAPTVSDPASIPVRAVGSVLQVLGLVITTWRVCFRLRIHRFWWEDAWAVVAFFSCLASLVGEWTNLLTYDFSSVIGYWFYTLGYSSVVGTTHLSLLFSIIRVIPATRLRKFVYLVASCLGIFWIVALLGKSWWCASPAHWHHMPPACTLGPRLAIFGFVSNCVAVGALIAIPLRVLRRAKLPRRQRRMILAAFASSIVLAFVATFHLAGYILGMGVMRVAGIDFENACSIIVCNLLVVVTYAYRFLWPENEDSEAATSNMDSDDFTQSRERTGRLPMSLTTVEIGSSLTQQYTTQVSF